MASDKLSQAVALIKAGNKSSALPILKEIVQENPQDEHAWLWLYSCVEETGQKKYCLKKALEINPHNQHAQQALQKLSGSIPQFNQQNESLNTTSTISANKSERDNRRPFWPVALGVLGIFLCISLSVFLAQTGQLSALAADLGLFAKTTPTSTSSNTAAATFTPSPSAEVSETATLLPSATVTPSSAPTGFAGIVPLEALESYRLKGTSMSETAFGGSSPMQLISSYTKEWVKASLAQHTIALISSDPTSNQPPTTMETISIGKTTWIKNQDDWARIDSQQLPSQQTTIDWQSLKFVGEEMVNGIPCKHYTVDEDIMKVSGMGNGQDIITHAQGDIWVANRPDLPPVILRMKIQTQMSGFSFSLETPPITGTFDPFLETMTQEPEGTVSHEEYEVTDVNTTIIIEPPDATAGP